MDEFGEFVDHEHQPGETHRRRPLRLVFPGGVHVDRPQLMQASLPTAQLGFERSQGPLRSPPVQVGDEPDRMRKVGAVREHARPLVVHQDEVDGVGPVGEGQAGHQSLQELTLPRTRRSGHERVRAVPFEIKEKSAVYRDAHHRPGGSAPGAPSVEYRAGVIQINAGHVHEAHR